MHGVLASNGERCLQDVVLGPVCVGSLDEILADAAYHVIVQPAANVNCPWQLCCREVC
ncbi:hypothetical protein D3C72_2041190 [compost metagenome]